MFVSRLVKTESIPGSTNVQNIPSDQKCFWISVSMVVMFMFAQLVSRPKLTFLMKSVWMSVIGISGPTNDDI